MDIEGYILAVIFLGFCSYQDIRKKEISWKLLAAGTAAAILFQLCARKLELWNFLGGIAVGLALLAVAFATREALGYGDGLAVMAAGMFLGFSGVVEVLLIAFFLAAFAAGVLLAVKKVGRKYELPFLPFLEAAAVVCMAVEGIG